MEYISIELIDTMEPYNDICVVHFKQKNPLMNTVNGLLPMRQQFIHRVMDDYLMTSIGFNVSAVEIRK